MGFIEEQTAPKKISGGAKGKGGAKSCYEIETDKDWFGAVGLFGGYVNAIVLQALTMEVDDPARLPRSLMTHFLRPYPAGKLQIEVEVERAGSSVTVLSFKTFMEGKLCGLGTGTFGKHRTATEYTATQPPAAMKAHPYNKSEMSSTHRTSLDSTSLPFFRNFKIWVVDRESAKEKSEVHAWVMPAPADNQTPNNLLFVNLCDAIPPVIFLRNDFRSHFAGTMDFTMHFLYPETELAPGEPIFGRLATAAARSGYVDEDCQLFSQSGELLFQSRQMRFIQKVGEEKAAELKLKDSSDGGVGGR